MDKLQEKYIVHYVPDETDLKSGCNIHTHGLMEEFGHPDIQIVIPLSPKVVGGILYTCVQKIAEECFVFVPGKLYSDIIGNGLKVKFVEAMECDRKVLRLILPCPKGHLNKEDMTGNFDHQFDGVL